MRLCEIIFLVSVSLSVVILLVSSRTRPLPAVLSMIPFSLPVVFIIHFFLESPRWQMIPAYTVGAVIIIISLFRMRRRKKEQRIFFQHKKKKPLAFLLTLLFIILLCCILLPALLPVFTLPPPTGEYGVGTTWVTVADKNRPEIDTDNPDDFRTLALKIWYPSRQDKKLKKDSYWPGSGQIGKALARIVNLPWFFFSHFSLVKTGSYIDAEIAADKEKFPLIIALYGLHYTDNLTDVYVLGEEFASRGYIVIGIAHPYSGLPVIYPDNTAAICPASKIQAMKEQANLSDAFWKTYFNRIAEQKEEFLKKIVDIDSLKISEIRVRSDDVVSVLSWLALANEGKIPSIINNRCDLDKIGCIGIHLGGSTAFHVFSNDARIKACVNLDGFHYTSPADRKIAKPYLFFSSETSRFSSLDEIKKPLTRPSRVATIKGTSSGSFTGVPFYSPLFDLFRVYGPLPRKKVAEITRTYSVAFFSAHLLREDALLLQTAKTAFPELEVVEIE